MLRNAMINAALVVASLVLTGFVFDRGLRLCEGVPLFEFRNFARDDVDQFEQIRTSIYDATLGWRVKPNLGVSHPVKGIQITETTDSDGNRLSGRSWATPKTGAILASGDSFTYGTDVSDGQSWPAIAEGILGRPIINAASQGWGTDQIVMHVESVIDRIQPRALIICLFWHDIVRTEFSLEFGAYKPYYTVEDDDRLVLHNVPVPHFEGDMREMGVVRGILGHFYALVWFSRRLHLQWFGSNYGEMQRAIPANTGKRISCLLLRRLRDRLAGRPTRLILVMVYANEDFNRPHDESATAVLDCAGGLGYERIDTWDSFAAIHDADPARFRTLWIYPEHWSHMSAAGNALVARAVADRLIEDGVGRQP